MSGNHNQSLARALEIVDAVAKTGAHTLKNQTYTPDTMTLDLDEPELNISDPNSLWPGKSLYQLYGEDSCKVSLKGMGYWRESTQNYLRQNCI
jgi:sialic acid synthase SpsE